MVKTAKPSAPLSFKKIAVIGFGLTGQSVMRFFEDSTTEIIAMDTRAFAPDKQDLQLRFPNARLVTGGLDQHTLETADVVVLSPGVDARELDLVNRVGKNTQIMGDIQLFKQQATAPILAITGSNGKSTVATLVDLMINAAGMNSLLGGNIGIPALDLFAEGDPDFYVLELSSFQLDSVDELNAEVAVVLNISEDHLDRYADFDAYIRSKASIYRGVKREVVNRDEPTAPAINRSSTISFGFSLPDNEQDYGLLETSKGTWIVKGKNKVLEVASLGLQGRQNWSNVMAALAMLDQAGVSISPAVIKAAQAFTGLAHRCEEVAVIDGVRWVNDSKGTNVAASMAAITGITEPKVLIMGGQGKGADFSLLKSAMNDSVRAVMLLGQDAVLIEAVIGQQVNCLQVESLEQAVEAANKLAKKGDTVLFSPACASFDMFANFAERGDAFKAQVRVLQGGVS